MSVAQPVRAGARVTRASIPWASIVVAASGAGVGASLVGVFGVASAPVAATALAVAAVFEWVASREVPYRLGAVVASVALVASSALGVPHVGLLMTAVLASGGRGNEPEPARSRLLLGVSAFALALGVLPLK